MRTTLNSVFGLGLGSAGLARKEKNERKVRVGVDGWLEAC